MTDKLEQKIQKEITKRVLEQYELLQEEHDKLQDTDATLEALEDITSIPRKELNRIAKDVRSIYMKENLEKQRWKKVILFFITICALVFVVLPIFKSVYEKIDEKSEQKKAALIKKMNYKVVFTTGIKNYKPVNSINKISINNKKLYFFIKLLSLEANSEYRYFFKIYDSKGTLILETTPNPITSPDNRHNIWCWHTLDPITDVAGNWRFEAYLDGVKFVERTLKVLPAR